MRQADNWHRPFEFRLVPQPGSQTTQRLPQQQLWLRAVDRLPDHAWLHCCLLAYVSDFHLLGTAGLPHAATTRGATLVRASIDHAMWFHRPFRIDEWMLYATDSPSAAGARGFARGSLYRADGTLVASTAQEGLMRVMAAGAQRNR
jgi:acyl-CoA thioesterase II